MLHQPGSFPLSAISPAKVTYVIDSALPISAFHAAKFFALHIPVLSLCML